MKRWVRGLSIVASVIVFIPIFAFVSLYATAAYDRLHAEKLLACARRMQPGLTTQDEFKAAFIPFAKDLSHGSESVSGRPTIVTDEYTQTNSPAWVNELYDHLPESATRFLGRLMEKLAPQGAAFVVSPRFAGAKLSRLEVAEMLNGVDGIHPFVARVESYSRPEEVNDPRLPDAGPNGFIGYAVDEYIESYENASGPVGPSWTIRQIVGLDDRATHEERQRAYNFSLRCFTAFRRCKDAHEMLQPAPNRR